MCVGFCLAVRFQLSKKPSPDSELQCCTDERSHTDTASLHTTSARPPLPPGDGLHLCIIQLQAGWMVPATRRLFEFPPCRPIRSKQGRRQRKKETGITNSDSPIIHGHCELPCSMTIVPCNIFHGYSTAEYVHIGHQSVTAHNNSVMESTQAARATRCTCKMAVMLLQTTM